MRHRLPENPGAWELHEVFHKKVREQRKAWEDGGEVQRLNHETAEWEARRAAQSGNVRCADGRRRAVRLQGGLAQISQGQPRGYRPESRAYYGLGAVLANCRNRTWTNRLHLGLEYSCAPLVQRVPFLHPHCTTRALTAPLTAPLSTATPCSSLHSLGARPL